MMRISSLFVLALLGCGTAAEDIPDADGDGTADPHDCADDDAAIHPGATELCNEVDDNCDGVVDEGVEVDVWPDQDGDGFGSGSAPSSGCGGGNGWAASDDDCNDRDAAVHPGAEDLCNGIDDNCDGVKDAEDTTWFADADGDGFGDDTTAVATCQPPGGYITVGGDCNDADNTISPGATELCNAQDDDCDGVADLGYETTWYSDADGDGHGSPLGSQTTCAPPSGWVLVGDDCRPSEASAYPGATEACNDVDDDCDGTTDEGFDVDGDGHYDAACSFGDDCDDTDDTVYPKAHEVCGDGLDQDCDSEDIHCGFSGAYASADLTAKVYDAGKTTVGGHLNVGDINGDGFDDVVTNGYFFENSLFVTYGPITEDVDMSAESYEVSGDGATIYGTRSLGVADVNGDGYDDVALGAPYGQCGTYIAYGPITADVDLASDADTTFTTGPNTYGGHGTDVGDLTGDGVAEVIVGAYYTTGGAMASGKVYIKNGPLTGDHDKDDADSVLSGAYPNGYAGRWIRAGQDMNGDGVGDVVIAAPYENSAGVANGTLYVFYGPPPSSASLTDGDVMISGPNNSYLGEYRTFSQGDADGDGVADLAAASTTASKAWLFLSPITATDTTGAVAEISSGGGGTIGYGISVEDVDQNGRGDLLFGAYTASTGYLFWDLAAGSYTSADADATFLGAAVESLGYSAAFGDMDGDGFSDVLIGGTGILGTGTGSGGFYVAHFAN